MRQVPQDVIRLLRVLTETARADGQTLLVELAGKKAKAWNALPEVGPTLKRRLKSLWDKDRAVKSLKKTRDSLKRNGEDWLLYYNNLPTLTDKTEFIGFLALYVAAYAGGAMTGLQLPGQKMSVYPKTDESKSLTLHAIPLLSLEIFVEWGIAVIERTLAEPFMIDDRERRRLMQIKQILSNFLGGVGQGANVRLLALGRKPGPWNLNLRFPIDLAAFEMIRALFSSTVEEALPSEDDKP